MSTTPRQYLYTAEDIYGKDGLDEGMSRDEIWHAYEAARAKDAELIQELVDGLAMLQYVFASEAGYETRWGDDALDAASAAGFKPSEP